MNICTNKLTGPVLDLTVATILFPERRVEFSKEDGVIVGLPPDDLTWRKFSPSTEWTDIGPIIFEERIELTLPNPDAAEPLWAAESIVLWDRGEIPEAVAEDIIEELGRFHPQCRMLGSTPLIAASRCFIGKYLGDSVEVPDGLITVKETNGN